MKNYLILLAFVFAMTICNGQISSAEAKTSQVKSSDPKKVVIFVRDDTGQAIFKDKAKALEFSLSSRINNFGFAVINHDIVLRNLNEYLGNPNAKYRSNAEKLKKNLQKESLGSKLFQESSGLRLSEMIGADYIISVSLASFGKENKSFNGYGIKADNAIYRLRSNYNLYEGGFGAGMVGGAINSEKVIRQISNLKVNSDDIINELIDNTASEMASRLREQNASGKIVAKENASAVIKIQFVIRGMEIPEIVNKDGKYVISTNNIPVSIPFVNADIDGVSQTIGGEVSLSKGIHNLKILQRDIAPIEKNIFVTGNPNQIISFTLELNDEARKRWKSDMAFIEQMKDRARLSEERRIITEAEAQRIRGIGKMYEQSGFKVDAKELPEIRKTQSIFSN